MSKNDEVTVGMMIFWLWQPRKQQHLKIFLPSSLVTSCMNTSTDTHWIRIVSTGELTSLRRFFGWNFREPAPQNEDAQHVLPLLHTDVVRMLVCSAHPIHNLGGEFNA